MKLSSLPVSTLLSAFRSPEPTPGGGSAAALAGAMGASLLAMVASLPKSKAASDDERHRLASAGERCTALALRLEALVDQDSAAYELVVSAFRLPKATPEEKSQRSVAIQSAMVAATEAPLEVMRRCAEALDQWADIEHLGNPNAASDAEVGRLLLGAAIRGARQNVDINLGSIKDEDYVERVRAESAAMDARLG